MSESTIAVASRRDAFNEIQVAGAKVVVACKMPGGLELRVHRMVPGRELVMGGGVRETEVAEFAGKVFVNGTSKKVEQSHACIMIGGYAITSGVSKELWDQWFEANKDGMMVKNGLIFAADNIGKVEGMAKERALVRSNLEPMNADPKLDPRAPKPVAGLTIEAGTKAA